MTKLTFKSVLGKYFLAFYEEQISLGIKSSDKLMRLHVYDNYLFQKGENSILMTQTKVNEMLDYLVNQEGRDRYRYTSTFSMFAKYLVRLGIPCYIPIKGKIPKSTYKPYIYTHDEINKIFKAADSLTNRNHLNNTIIMIMPSLIRLLYSTAIRLGEALSLRNKDVDFEHHTITLNKTKNQCQRIAPLNLSMESVLKTYISYRNRLPIEGIDNPESFLFVNLMGKPCTGHTVLTRFVEILKNAGITYKGNHLGPRIHDLRHTACVHAMVKMVKDGKDIYCSLPYIAAFMGHKHYQSTYKYLRLSKDMFPDIIKLNYSTCEVLDTAIFETVTFDNYDE